MAACQSWISVSRIPCCTLRDSERSRRRLLYSPPLRVPISRKVTPMAGMAAATTPLKLEKVTLTKRHLEKAKQAMDPFVQSIRNHPEKREGAAPYYLLHGDGDAVYGTVLMFHGFSSSTWQMSLLAQYLYENGFNVYQPGLAGHGLLNPDKNWPKHDLKPAIKEKLAEKLLSDPKLEAYIRDFISISTLTADQASGAVGRLTPLNEQELYEAICDEEFTDSKFYKYYNSEHMKYFHEAEKRLKEVEALPGPIFTVGLSMGGATALSLAALHSEKVAKTAVFAPLLKIINQGNCRFSKLTGPLGAHEKGWYPEMPFLLSCMVAVDVFGHFVREEKHLDVLAKLPTLIVQTEIDDSADHAVGLQIIKEIQDRTDSHSLESVRPLVFALENVLILGKSNAGKNGPPHFSTLYAAAEAVPHPMVHPLESSLGHTNAFWQSLYQETFRFLTEGIVEVDHLHEKNQDPALPQVPPLVLPAMTVT